MLIFIHLSCFVLSSVEFLEFYFHVILEFYIVQLKEHDIFQFDFLFKSDLPPPPPELIDDEEEQRASFGSSAPGVQSKTFKMLQESIGNDQGDSSHS